MQANAVSADGQEMPLIKVIAETLKFIGEQALNKLR